LDDEDVPPPGVAVDPDEDLPVCEVADEGPVDGHFQKLADLVGEGSVRPSGQKEQWTSSEGLFHAVSSPVFCSR
jgi:hypothetical protein